MRKVKKAISLWLMLLVTAIICLTAVGCANKNIKQGDNLVPSDEGDSYGLYTNLALSLDGGDGQVQATVKNRLTIFPSAVTVKVELYNSEKYQESFSDMTLVAENYVADLNQGKTVTATSSTNGKQSYWKARMCYRIDGDGWKERETNTVLLDKNGIITSGKEKVVEGGFYTVTEAYELGLLTREQLMSIAYYHNGGNYMNEDIMGENYVPLPKIPEAPGEETDKAIKDSFYNSEYWGKYEGHTQDEIVYGYFGTYGNVVAVKISVYGEGTLLAVFEEKVDGIMIYSRSYNRVLIWVSNI